MRAKRNGKKRERLTGSRTSKVIDQQHNTIITKVLNSDYIAAFLIFINTLLPKDKIKRNIGLFLHISIALYLTASIRNKTLQQFTFDHYNLIYAALALLTSYWTYVIFYKFILHRKRFDRYGKVKAVLVIALIFTITAISFQVINQYFKISAFNKDSKIHILIAILDDSYEREEIHLSGRKAQKIIYEALNCSAAESFLSNQLEIKLIPKVIYLDKGNDAKRYLQQNNASMIIWGSVLQSDKQCYSVHITVDDQFINDCIVLNSVNPKIYQIDSIKDYFSLTDNPITISKCILALNYLHHSDYRSAKTLFESIISSLKIESPTYKLDKAMVCYYDGICFLCDQAYDPQQIMRPIQLFQYCRDTWATVENNGYNVAIAEEMLGLSYDSRIFASLSMDEREYMIKKALDHYSKAQYIFTKDKYPASYVQIESSIAKLYSIEWLLHMGDKADNNTYNDLCIQHYLSSINILKKQNYYGLYADCLYNLGSCYFRMTKHHGDANYNIGIKLYIEAIAEFRKDDNVSRINEVERWLNIYSDENTWAK